MVAARLPLAEPVPLTVVIVTYECRDHVTACLASLAADAEEHGYEVIVVDNASTDGTAEAVRRCFPWAQLIEAGANSGFSVANNIALRWARGEHVLLLNPDTVVPRGALAEAIAALDARPDVGMLGVKLVQETGELDHACKRGFPTPLSSLGYFTRIAPKAYTAGHVGADETSYVDAVNGAFMLVRREALEDVGPLDEGFWLYMEDLDWCYRFWQAGWKILYWPGVAVTHVKGGSAGSLRSWKANRAFHGGMWTFYAKHYRARYGPGVALVVRLAIWGKLLVSAARSAIGRARA